MVEETAQAAGGLAGIIGPLGVNGKLFVAQLINVAIIVLVMWRWVYRPLMKALDDRTKKIEKGLADAAEAADLKEAAEEEKSAAVVSARLKAKEIVEQAEAEAQQERERIAARAKQDVEKIVAEGKEQLQAEKAKLIQQAKSAASELLVLAVEKVAKEKLDAKKDERLIRDSLKSAMERL